MDALSPDSVALPGRPAHAEDTSRRPTRRRLYGERRDRERPGRSPGAEVAERHRRSQLDFRRSLRVFRVDFGVAFLLELSAVEAFELAFVLGSAPAPVAVADLAWAFVAFPLLLALPGPPRPLPPGPLNFDRSKGGPSSLLNFAFCPLDRTLAI